jgi:hypothetical protein
VIFTGLYYTTPPGTLGNLAWVYPATALACIVMLFLDGTIQRIFRKMKVERSGIGSKQRLLDDLNLKQVKLDDLFSAEKISLVEHTKRSKQITKKILKFT